MSTKLCGTKTQVTHGLRLRCDRFATKKKWQSQRGLKGLGKVLLKLPKGLRLVAGPNSSRAVFWACTKDWSRLIWSLRGFIGLLEVSKRSYVSRRSVADDAAIGFTTKRAGIFTICDWSVMRRWSVSALSPTSRQSVAKWFPRVCQSFGDGFTNVTNLSAHDCVISQQVLEEFRWTVKNGMQKFEEKRPSCCPRSQPVLPSHSPYQSSVHHHDLLFAGAATATVQLLTFWKLAKKWFDYERHPFYMHLFWLRIDRQLVTDQSSLSCNQSPIFTD